MTGLLFLAALAVLLVLIYQGKGFLAWVSAGVLVLAGWLLGGEAAGLFFLALTVFIAAVLLFGVKPLRRALVSRGLMGRMRKALPTLSVTERTALEAGSVGWESEFFTGQPDWQRLLDFDIRDLSGEERAFLDGPVQELCAMLDDWRISRERDLPPEVWRFIKEKRFFGIIIPQRFGGLGFSAAAHSAVVTRLSGRSGPAAVTVMVPNSLGPAELLLHYGTPSQQEHYLPRLARGEEIPCFALTEPHAGSDAASGRSFGIVCREQRDGQEVLGIRLTFDKRYITLAPVATVVGLAFRLFDPQRLLGGEEEIGITCALIPRDTPGLWIGNRHDPMGIPFQNGPVRGKDVFIPPDWIIGGREYAGQGWRMLMEQLSAGRGISLPSLSSGGAQLTTRATSAHAIVREQFGLPIGKFEGVRERLGRIAGYTYFMNATRRLTVGAVDAGEKPAIATAITKAYLTEGMRTCVNDGMDLMAGNAICRGPRNILSRLYIAIPIGITVEGANILTRSMIIFGQGAIRCHPFVLREMEAIQAGDLKAFDEAFFSHLNHMARNKQRAFFQALTGGRFSRSPLPGPLAPYFRHVNRLSAAFAFAADVALVVFGGSLKRREYLSSRFADVLAWLYIASAVLKHHHDGRDAQRDMALAHWSLRYSLYQAERALALLVDNLPGLPRAALRLIAFPLGARLRPPSDRQTDAVVDALLDPATGVRDALTADVYVPAPGEAGMGRLEHAWAALQAAHAARAKVHAARREGEVPKGTMEDMAKAAHGKGLVSAGELAAVLASQEAVNEVIQVDDFPPVTSPAEASTA